MRGLSRYLGAITLAVTLSLVGCKGTQMMQHQHAAVSRMSNMLKQGANQDARMAKRAPAALPDVVSRALSAPSQHNGTRHWRRFDVAVNQMPARNFFSYLASHESVNIIVSPKVSGNVTLNLNQVTLPEVFHAVADAYQFRVIKEDFGFKVLASSLVTRIYTVDWLLMQRSGTSSMNVNDMQTGTTGSGGGSGGGSSGGSSTVSTTFGEGDYWQEIQAAINQIIAAPRSSRRSRSRGRQSATSLGKRSVTINKSNGLIMVRATPGEQALVAQYLRSMHAISSKQVVIDARVIEVELKKNQQLGLGGLGLPYLNWTNSATSSTLTYGSDASSSNTDTSSAATGTTTGTTTGATTAAGGPNFSTVIDMLSSVGRVSILSSPRISTMNNQKALIKVGQDQYFSMGQTTTVVGNAAGTADNALQQDNLQSFFAGIALDVTPQIDDHNQVTMHIHPIVSSITKQNITMGGGKHLELPITKVRETDTVVKAKSGQIIIIGGLISETSDLSRNKVPGFEGYRLNTNRSDTYDKKELFILLRPTVVDDRGWVNELDQAGNDFAKEFGHQRLEPPRSLK